jgi:hypothetical protein
LVSRNIFYSLYGAFAYEGTRRPPSEARPGVLGGHPPGTLDVTPNGSHSELYEGPSEARPRGGVGFRLRKEGSYEDGPSEVWGKPRKDGSYEGPSEARPGGVWGVSPQERNFTRRPEQSETAFL